MQMRIVAANDGGGKKDTQQSSNIKGGMFVHLEAIPLGATSARFRAVIGRTPAEQGWFAEKWSVTCTGEHVQVKWASRVALAPGALPKVNLKAAQTNYPAAAFYD